MDSPVEKYDWAVSCAEKLLDASSLSIQVASDGQTPVAIAPLTTPHGLFRAVEQLATQVHGEPGDFLYTDSNSLDYLTENLAKKNMPLFLFRVPENSPVVAAIKKAYARRGLVICRPQPGCPFIEIAADEKQTSERLPSRLRSDLRRARRKAEAIGEVTFEIHSPSTQSEFVPLWEDSIRIEAAGWKGRSHSALKENQKIGSFYKSYAARACEHGILRSCLLRIGGQPVAMQLAIESNNRFWLLKIGYDENFSGCSPGMLLMHETLRYAANNKLSTYEFLGSAAEWTRRWTQNERKTIAIRTYPYTVKGVALFTHDVGKYLFRKMRAKIGA
jgi:Acetyltransferase (GNAT) domain